MEPQWQFDPYCLEPGNARLYRENEPLRIPPLEFEVLCYLVARAGKLVTRDELLDAVWGRRFVSDSALKGRIHSLRAILGDSPQAPRYIETVWRRGYRFIGTVNQK